MFKEQTNKDQRLMGQFLNKEIQHSKNLLCILKFCFIEENLPTFYIWETGTNLYLHHSTRLKNHKRVILFTAAEKNAEKT